MERVSLIIKKLQQLVDDNAGADILLAIAQMLVTELQQQQPEGLRGISVTVPKRNFIVEETAKEDEPPVEHSINSLISEEEVLTEPQELAIDNEDKVEETIEEPSYILNAPQEEITPTESTKEEYILVVPDEEPEEIVATHTEYQHPLEATSNAFFFQSNTTDIPTLPRIEETKPEINEVLAKEENDINNQFKEHKVEVVHLHENTHIKDLKRAISINEKYLFINELFRGDEGLYDKCIKHIQQFSILPEATFWIQKELKTKLDWPENDEVVQLFDQLVKRRFS